MRKKSRHSEPRPSLWAKRLAVVSLLAAAGALCLPSPLVHSASACAFHTSLPARTLVDELIESDHIVLARPDEQNGYSYRVVETLRDGGRPVVLRQLVDSAMRRSLIANPHHSVLFVFDTDAEDWVSIAYLDEERRRIIDTVMTGMRSWGPDYDPGRFAIFEALQDHPDAILRALALQELDRASYKMLRTLDLRFSVDELLDGLWSMGALPYVPIRALLLGLSKDERARAEINTRIEKWSSGYAPRYLGAFATALIESEGAAGVDKLAELYLADPSQRLDTLEMVVEAMAIQSGANTPAVRHRIAEATAALTSARPGAAALVVRQFGSRNDWSQAEHLKALLSAKAITSAADLLPVVSYVAMAERAVPDAAPR